MIRTARATSRTNIAEWRTERTKYGLLDFRPARNPVGGSFWKILDRGDPNSPQDLADRMPLVIGAGFCIRGGAHKGLQNNFITDALDQGRICFKLQAIYQKQHATQVGKKNEIRALK